MFDKKNKYRQARSKNIFNSESLKESKSMKIGLKKKSYKKLYKSHNKNKNILSFIILSINLVTFISYIFSFLFLKKPQIIFQCIITSITLFLVLLKAIISSSILIPIIIYIIIFTLESQNELLEHLNIFLIRLYLLIFSFLVISSVYCLLRFFIQKVNKFLFYSFLQIIILLIFIVLSFSNIFIKYNEIYKSNDNKENEITNEIFEEKLRVIDGTKSFIEKLKNNLAKKEINSTIIGIPLKIPIIKNENYSLTKYLYNNIVDEKLLLKQNKSSEIVIDIANQNISLNINKNHLIERNDTDYNNILVLYLDSINKILFEKKMTRVTKFIQDKYHNKNNIINTKENITTEENISSFRFIKYYSYKENENESDTNYKIIFDNENIINFYKSQGYITGNSMNNCSKLSDNKYDHENILLFCSQKYKKYAHKILFNKSDFEYVLDYGRRFWETYKDNKKFLNLRFTNIYDPSGSILEKLDYSIYKFLVDLENNNLFEKSTLFIISDIGNYNSKIKRHFEEEKLGVFYLISDNNNLLEKEKDNLFINQIKTITPLDIYKSLVYISFSEKNRYSINDIESIFNSIEDNQQKSKNIYPYDNNEFNSKNKIWKSRKCIALPLDYSKKDLYPQYKITPDKKYYFPLEQIQKNMTLIPIVMSTNSYYVTPTLVTLTSIFEKKTNSSYIYLFILTSPNVNDIQKYYLKSIEKNYTNINIFIIDMKDSFSNVEKFKLYSESIYYRISAFLLFPQFEKLIYLDSDVLAFDDLNEMINIDPGNYLFLGFRDYTIDPLKEHFNLTRVHILNTGVMIMNTKALRERDTINEIKGYFYKYNGKFAYHDQDVINYLYYNFTWTLPPKFGVWVFEYDDHCLKYNNALYPEFRYDEKELLYAYHHPVIMHMVWPKPWWKSGLDHQFFEHKLWTYYCKKSGYYHLCEQLEEMNKEKL